MIPSIFGMLFILGEVVREKDLRLRKGLIVYGVPHFSYWASWVLVALAYSLFVTLSTIASGYLFQFDFFKQTPLLVIIMMFWPFNLAMFFLGFVIAVASPDLKSANSASYAFVLLAIVIQGFLNNHDIIAFIYEVKAGWGIVLLRTILCFYPPFSYTKIFSTITLFSGRHFNIKEGKWVKGVGFKWSDFTTPLSGLDMAG